ncbi:MAG: MMPL family transporter, partial [Pseudomonadota bacterium]
IAIGVGNDPRQGRVEINKPALAPGGDVFRPEVMEVVETLTERGWQIPYSIRVDSVTNFQYTYAEEDDLIVEDLVGNPAGLSEAQFAEKRAIALAEPLIVKQILTEDGTATAVNVVLHYPQVDPNEVFETGNFGRALRDELNAAYPDIEVTLSGVAMLNNAFAESGQRDFSTLVPAMFGLVLILTILTVRSVSATLATLMVIVLSIFVSMGVAGMARIALTPISMSAIIVILTLAVADSIHILLTMRTNMQEGMAKREALIDAIRVNFLAVGITSLTTIVGFLALNFSDAPPFKHLGNMSAVGIFAAWFFSITLLPALISLMPFRPKVREGGAAGARLMEAFGRFVVGRLSILAGVCAVVAVVLVAQIPRIEFNDQWTEYFGTRLDFRSQTDIVTEEFGLYPVEFSVPAGEVGGVSEPEYLERLDAFANWLRAQEQVVHVYSLSDIMKRLNKNLNADDEAFYRLPTDRELSAQYLLLYELSLPYGLDLNDRVDIEKSATRVTATLGEVTTGDTKVFLRAAEKYIEENFPVGQRAAPTSAQVMFTFITDRNVQQMIRGTVVAVIAISFIMVLALRNVRLGLLSLVPNGLPILTAFGVWAIMIGEVGFSVAVVAAISLGIVVDDTVHLMTKYLRARRERALEPKDAIVYAFSHVGLAIFVNTIILSVGFSLLMMSTFKVTVDMGLLTMLSILFAMIFDFLLLPALLVWTDRSAPRAA